MFRPVFGRGKASVISAIDNKRYLDIYPNPNQGQFNIPLEADRRSMSIINLMGSLVEFEWEVSLDKQTIKLSNPTPGIYILRYRIGNVLQSAKVWVRN